MYAQYPQNTSYETYSPSRRYLQSELSYKTPAESTAVDRYLQHVDEILKQSQPILPDNPFDLASLVFANQASQHSLSSSQLAQLIQERRAMADIHKFNIKFRLDDLISARSIVKMLDPADSGGRLGSVERQILDLDKQERDLQTSVWKDTLELRTKLLEERSQYHGTIRRTQMLQGGIRDEKG